ncbi:Hypothetical protein (Fragment), partial [Durusdinium trenchii]
VLPTLEVHEFPGKGPAAIRLKDITAIGFSAIIAKPPKSGKVEPGLKQDPWGEIEETRFEHTFTRPPALLTTIQTVNNEKGLPSNSRPWLTVAVQRVNEDSTKAEASEFPRSRLDIVARLDGSRIEVALEMSETTEYGKVDEREKVGWIAIEQGIHTLLGSTGV